MTFLTQSQKEAAAIEQFVKPTFHAVKGYKNNPSLKKPGQEHEWTETGIKEYTKCAQDPQYFIETYMRIVHVDEGLIPFKLRGYQKTMIRTIHDQRRVIMCMARQSGKTTAVVGYILWYILFNPHVTAALLANKGETALELLSKAHLAYMHLPIWLQQGIVEWNKGSIALENGSRVIADATSVDAMSGYTVNLLVVDEVAKIDNWEEFSASVIPTISSGKTTKIVQISTPKGLNHFYHTWINAQPDSKTPNGYNPISVHWKEVPGRDEEWRVNALAELNNDNDKFAQEYECEFLGSSGTLIAGWKLKELLAHVKTIKPLYATKDLLKFKDAIPQHVYAITVDVSEGKTIDYHVAQVVDVTTIPYDQVAIYRSNEAAPAEFSQVLYELGRTYNEAMILIEFNCALGAQVATELFEQYDYGNLLSTKSKGQHGIQIVTESGPAVNRGGVKISASVRRTGCSLLKLLIEQNKFLIHDFETVKELCTFSRDEGKVKFEAEPGNHDDTVMAAVIFAWMTDQNYFQEHTNIKTIQELREQDEKQIVEDLTPFGFVDQKVIHPDPVVEHNFNDLMYRRGDRHISWIVYDDTDENPPNF